jgi:hypothetical protein
MMQEAVIACFKVLFEHLLARLRKNKKIFGEIISTLTLESKPSQTLKCKERGANFYTATFGVLQEARGLRQKTQPAAD